MTGRHEPALQDQGRAYGRHLRQLLAELAQVAGSAAVAKVMAGKLCGGTYGGHYVRGVLGSPSGEALVCELLARLLWSEVVPLASVSAYYDNGRRVPTGMRLQAGELVDIIE